MASLEFQDEKKAKAMTRSYKNRRKLQNLFCLFNMAAALFVFWRTSWFTIAFSHFRSLLFNSTFCLILLGNVIILSVYALSDHDNGKSGAQSDILDEFINDVESRLEISTNGGSPSEDRHQIVIWNSLGDYSPEKEMITMVGRELERRLCSLEELTEEEFNRAVEDFIAKQKRRQIEEHKESYRTEYLALAQ